MKMIIAILALLSAHAPAWAKDVTLSSEVFAERVKKDAAGNSEIVLEEPRMVTPGDRLLFVLAFKNEGNEPATDFIINNPVPSAVRFAGTDSADAILSVDGGKSWGALAALKVKQADGTLRGAVAADVTNVKWQFTRPIAVGAAGKVSFRAIVR